MVYKRFPETGTPRYISGDCVKLDRLVTHGLIRRKKFCMFEMDDMEHCFLEIMSEWVRTRKRESKSVVDVTQSTRKLWHQEESSYFHEEDFQVSFSQEGSSKLLISLHCRIQV